MTGAECRAKRNARGWTQRQLAARAGLSQAAVYKLELGREESSPVVLRRIEFALRRGECLPRKSQRRAASKPVPPDGERIVYPAGAYDGYDREMIGT